MFYFLKRKLIGFLPSILLLILLNDKVLINGHSTLVRSQEYNGANAGSNGLSALNSKAPNNGPGGGEIMKTTSLNLHEPSCEELRAMWQFSKRQSRASEITNEIPTYHDPFTYNVWDPPFYPTTTRSGGRRIGSSRYRDGNGHRLTSARPVYGRIVHKTPAQLPPTSGGRMFDAQPSIEQDRISVPYNYVRFGNENQVVDKAQQAKARQRAKVRFGGPGAFPSAPGSQSTAAQRTAIFATPGLNQIAPQRGSFQRLKELVWTERAKELQQQRKNEEMAVRAAILKDITNGQHYKTSLSSQASSRRTKSGPSSNKNKLLKDENKGFNNKDDMQLLSHSSYWPTNENVKRSQQQQQIGSEMNGNGDYNAGQNDINMFNIKALIAADPNAIDDENYIDDDDSLDYDVNGYFNSVNQDNINDFYYYINQLLSKKPSSQKSI